LKIVAPWIDLVTPVAQVVPLNARLIGLPIDLWIDPRSGPQIDRSIVRLIVPRIALQIVAITQIGLALASTMVAPRNALWIARDLTPAKNADPIRPVNDLWSVQSNDLLNAPLNAPLNVVRNVARIRLVNV
jgi:hypothetical protein